MSADYCGSLLGGDYVLRPPRPGRLGVVKSADQLRPAVAERLGAVDEHKPDGKPTMGRHHATDTRAAGL
jgi:hypothetical protein